MSVYLDNSATTPVCAEAKEKILYALNECWGNPSSTHHQGLIAGEALDEARESIAKRLFCDKSEIYFTSGGTQSNNIAVLGAVNRLSRRGNKIVTTDVEHPSVENAMKSLEERGFEVVRLPVRADGTVSEESLFNAIDEKTILVSMMAVNNEVGSIQPIEKMKLAVSMKKSPALIHCDAVQAFGKLELKVRKLGVDMMSLSSHKIHGPKGSGALYIRKGVNIKSPVYGGGQENGICSGTQAMPAIMGFAAAADALAENLSEQLAKTKELRDFFVNEAVKIPNLKINSSDSALPYVINISLLKKRSEPIINFLSEKGIYISGGSACSKGHRSEVLKKMGLEPERIDGALRISLSRFTTKEDMISLLEGLAEANDKLRGN